MHHRSSVTTLAFLFAGLLTLGVHAADPKPAKAPPSTEIKFTTLKDGVSRVDIPDSAKLDEEAWKKIEALAGVKMVSVKGTAFDNAALARLSKIATIENIVIYNPGFDDAGMAALANLPNLKTLNIDHGLTINGSGLAALDGKKLELFNIGGSKINDMGMEGIAKVSQLRDVTIRHVFITGAGFAQFGKMKGLQKLFFLGGFHPRVSGADLAHLSGLTNLEDLTIGEMVLTYDDGLIHLKPLRQLKKLTLKTCDVSEADLAKLKADLPETKILFTPATAENVKYWHDEVAKLKK